MKTLHCTVVAVAALLLASMAGAATVYRWVDDSGKVHYADVVPDRYKGRAQPMQASAPEPSAEQRREALERAQREKARAMATHSDSPVAAPSAAPASAASAPTSKRPSQIPDDRTDCETWQRLYEESAACFGAYRTVGGGVKPEAFEACNVVKEPPPTRCRMRIP